MDDNIEDVNKRPVVKFPKRAVVLFVLIACVIYFFNSFMSKGNLVKFVKKELVAQGYEVLQVKVSDYEAAFKGKKSSGTVTFTVKDKNGIPCDGKATVKNKSEWLVFNKRTFTIDEIKK